MTQEKPTTPEPLNPTDRKAPEVAPKSGLSPNPVPPTELARAEPAPGADRKGD